jgi:hypothetical protein
VSVVVPRVKALTKKRYLDVDVQPDRSIHEMHLVRVADPQQVLTVIRDCLVVLRPEANGVKLFTDVICEWS